MTGAEKPDLSAKADEELTEAVAKGQIERREMLQRFGFIPVSILRLSRGQLSRSMYNLLAERPGGSMPNKASRLWEESAKSPEAAAKAKRRRERGLRGSLGGLMSQKNRRSVSYMPAELVDFAIKYYAEPGQVYLDPFSAQGIQMQVAVVRGLHYWGSDCCEEYVAYTNNVLEKLAVPSELHVEVRCQDSRNADWVPDGIGDFSFYSPPYWNIEFYGPEPEQLGTGKTYEEFIEGMTEVARAWHPKFKDGAFLIINVGDWHRDGKLVPYHADTIDLMREAGYSMHDIWVTDGILTGINRLFAVQKNRSRVAPRIHEYLLVFRP